MPQQEEQCRKHTKRLDASPVSQVQNRSALNSGGLEYFKTERQN